MRILLVKKNMRIQEIIKYSGNIYQIQIMVLNCLRNILTKIVWKYLSVNEYAIDLLKERVEYEKNLSKDEYNQLGDDNKIDWLNMSLNKNAIELVKDRL